MLTNTNFMDYLEKAEIIDKCNFRMYGLGNFDIYEDEIAHILELLDHEKSEENIQKFYKELLKKRMEDPG